MRFYYSLSIQQTVRRSRVRYEALNNLFDSFVIILYIAELNVFATTGFDINGCEYFLDRLETLKLSLGDQIDLIIFVPKIIIL